MIEQINGTWVRVDSFEDLEIDDIWRRIEIKSGMDALEVYFECWVPDLPNFQADRVYINNKTAEFGSVLNNMVLDGVDVRGWEPLYRHHEHHTARRSVEEANASADYAERLLAEMQTVPQGGETVAVVAMNAQQRDNLLALLVAIQNQEIRGLNTGPWVGEVATNLGFFGDKTDWGNPKLGPAELAVSLEYAYNIEGNKTQ